MFGIISSIFLLNELDGSLGYRGVFGRRSIHLGGGFFCLILFRILRAIQVADLDLEFTGFDALNVVDLRWCWLHGKAHIHSRVALCLHILATSLRRKQITLSIRHILGQTELDSLSLSSCGLDPILLDRSISVQHRHLCGSRRTRQIDLGGLRA